MYKTGILLAGILALAAIGCSDQATDSGLTGASEVALAAPSAVDYDLEPIEETMQVSPFKINLLSKGTSESIMAIFGYAMPAGYHIVDFDFTLSFNGEAVVDAYDVYYCYIDNILQISFGKMDVINSEVTQALANTEAVATVDGYIIIESDEGTEEASFSRVAMVEIISPSQSRPDPEPAGSDNTI